MLFLDGETQRPAALGPPAELGALGRKREGARVPDPTPDAAGRGFGERQLKKLGPTAIGLFVLGALALIVAGVFFFGGGAFLAPRLPAVSFFHGSVAGLQIGAAVTYRGVEVGQVKSIGIRLDPKTSRSIVQVDMELVPDAVKVHGGDLPADETLVPNWCSGDSRRSS